MIFVIAFKKWKLFSEDTCLCECPKDDERNCKNKLHIYDEINCGCICPNFSTFDKTYCSTSRSSTLAKWFDPAKCECVCKSAKECTNIQTYNATTCDCDCNSLPVKCEQNAAWDKIKCGCYQCTECKTLVA